MAEPSSQPHIFGGVDPHRRYADSVGSFAQRQRSPFEPEHWTVCCRPISVVQVIGWPARKQPSVQGDLIIPVIPDAKIKSFASKRRGERLAGSAQNSLFQFDA